jgi:hypothetical protein
MLLKWYPGGSACIELGGSPLDRPNAVAAQARLSDSQGTGRVIALAGNLDIFLARVTARLAAKILANRNFANARDMLALLCFVRIHSIASGRG